MKCPFLTTKKDVFDEEGKKIGEEIELQDCVKNECMIFDGAIKLCSLLSSNMKTGVLIDDVKNGIKEIKEEMSNRTEALSVAVSTTLQTLQEALMGRFDILKKQNEVMVLGFDRLVETITNKFELIKSNFSEFTSEIKSLRDAVIEALKNHNETINGNFNTLKEIINNQGDSIKSATQFLQVAVNEIKNANIQFSGEVKTFSETLFAKLAEYNERSEQANVTTYSRLDILKENLEKLIATNQGGMEIVSGTIEKVVSTNQEVLTKLGQLDTLVSSIYSMNDLLRTEIVGLKTENVNILNRIIAKFDEFSTTFADTMKPGIDSMTEFMRTEIAGLKTESVNALNGISIKLDELALSFAESAKVSQEGLQSLIDKFGTLSDVIKTEVTGLRTDASNILKDFKNEMGNYIDGVKSEVINLKNDQIVALNNVQGTILQLQALFKESSDSLGSMNDMMRDLNNNYLESLGKIAGLAEGMRKGVDKVGEGMHDSVKDLVSEMKKEIGALEKQYEKTFGDIANLAGKFGELNSRIKEMTKEVESEFKNSFDRQAKLSDYTKTILEHIKEYFIKEEARYKEEQELRKKKEGLDHFDRATLYYYRGNYELAVNEINKALEIEKTAEYFNLKGLLLAELGKFDESKKIYKEALKLESDLAEIHNNLGLLYLRMKKLDDAVVSFQEAVKKNVNYALAYVNLGKALIESEKFDDAIKAYEKAVEIDPSNHDAREAIRLYKEGKIGG